MGIFYTHFLPINTPFMVVAFFTLPLNNCARVQLNGLCNSVLQSLSLLVFSLASNNGRTLAINIGLKNAIR